MIWAYSCNFVSERTERYLGWWVSGSSNVTGMSTWMTSHFESVRLTPMLRALSCESCSLLKHLPFLKQLARFQPFLTVWPFTALRASQFNVVSFPWKGRQKESSALCTTMQLLALIGLLSTHYIRWNTELKHEFYFLFALHSQKQYTEQLAAVIVSIKA